ncbi:hypothetical protein [Tropicimonas sp. S265A]|uniref:hypothetical protein n=1 Tax=Tropicimonas sp. S265A TaxID=3415134 RepID=UPI003C7BF0CF
MTERTAYLRRHTEALVKALGIEAAAELSGKSKATLGRYYSDAPEHAGRFMPIDTVVALEAEAEFPHVTTALAEVNGLLVSHDPARRNAGPGGVNEDVIALCERFAMLMSEYHQSIADGKISANEARRMLRETAALQTVLMEMKLRLEAVEA